MTKLVFDTSGSWLQDLISVGSKLVKSC